MADECKKTTDYERILTYTTDGQWIEWEPCAAPEPPEPQPPEPEPETYLFTLEASPGSWETESGDTFVQEEAV